MIWNYLEITLRCHADIIMNYEIRHVCIKKTRHIKGPAEMFLPKTILDRRLLSMRNIKNSHCQQS